MENTILDLQNPFRPLISLEESSYYGIQNKKLVHLITGKEAPAKTILIHGSLKGMCTSPTYPCPGTPKVFNKELERMLVYPRMSDCNIAIVAHDLFEYIKEYKTGEEGNDLTALVCFAQSETSDWLAFRKMLWAFLTKLANMQARYFGWAENYSSNTDDPNFSFSFAGVALYIAAFHNDSPRTSRKFVTPVLVMNPHEQFEKLKRTGVFPAWKDIVAKRDMALDGCQNPTLSDFGTGSEAASYDSVPGGVCPVKNMLEFERVKQIPAEGNGCPYKHLHNT